MLRILIIFNVLHLFRPDFEVLSKGDAQLG
jgi:hypothetical protein